MTPNNLNEYRCRCGKLLFKAIILGEGLVEIKCRRCRLLRTFSRKEPQSA